MIHRRPRRMPGIIPCSNIAYTARRPTPRQRAISGTEMRLLRRPAEASLECPELTSGSGSGIGVLSRVRKHRHVFAYQVDSSRTVQFCLAFEAGPSDESSCANRARKGYGETNMTNAEANTNATLA